MRLKPYLLPIVQFTLIGPGIGALVATLMGAGGSPTLSGGGFFLVLGYGVGLVPAALAGIIYVSAWNMRSLFRALSVGEYGAILGAISGAIAFGAFAMAMSGTPVPKSLAVYLIPILAGAFCGWLAGHARDEAHGWTHVS